MRGLQLLRLSLLAIWLAHSEPAQAAPAVALGGNTTASRRLADLADFEARAATASRRARRGHLVVGGGGAKLSATPVATAPTAQSVVDGFDRESNVCLLTIMTQERMASLHRMLSVWDGYVSIALLVDVYDEAAPEGINLLRYRGALPPAPQRIALSIVEDRNYRAPLNRFPYNVLRNLALKGCTAEYVMAADVDFVPYGGSSGRPSAALRESLTALDVRAGSMNVLVLAAFEEVRTTPPEMLGDSGGTAPPPNASAPFAAGAALGSTASGRRLSTETRQQQRLGLLPGGGGGGGGGVPHMHLDKATLRAHVRAGDIVGFASREYDAGHRCDHVRSPPASCDASRDASHHLATGPPPTTLPPTPLATRTGAPA